MAEIKCPNCGEVIKLDKSSYDALLNEIEKEELNRRIENRTKELEQNFRNELRSKLSERELEENIKIGKIRESANEELSKAKLELSKKENELTALKENQKTLIEKEISDEKLNHLKEKNDLESEIKSLKNKLELQQNKAESEKITALAEKDKLISDLNNKINIIDKEKISETQRLKELHAEEVKVLQSQVEYYKDLKTKMSTKMIGETLEQHCQNEFNRIRTAAYPRAYFEKDNDSSSGSKGDFIFKDYTGEGNELISIMFEMKNESDTTSTKHKNSDFFKELDKDRNEKGCEYAVLVSMLESDNDFYNAGITDVSYEYPKMFVVRPQCFLTIISLLRQAALSAEDSKNQLAAIKTQSIDVANFEDNLNNFKLDFSSNFESSSKKFHIAIDEIDKAIRNLEKIKENLTSSDRQLRIANDKVQNITIRKLTKNAPSIEAQFKELKKESK